MREIGIIYLLFSHLFHQKWKNEQKLTKKFILWGSFLQKKVLKSWVELGTGQEYLPCLRKQCTWAFYYYYFRAVYIFIENLCIRQIKKWWHLDSSLESCSKTWCLVLDSPFLPKTFIQPILPFTCWNSTMAGFISHWKSPKEFYAKKVN